MIRDYLKNNILICDGAMGTYYSEITDNNNSYCEFANINDKEVIKKIHKEYIDAGAKLIRTNTFSANTKELNVSRQLLKDIIQNGVDIAREAAGTKEIFIGASIGPIRHNGPEEEYSDILEEYKFITDCFLEKNINIFVFETYSSTEYLKEASEYIKKKCPEAFILTQFAVKPDGFTRDSITANKIIDEARKIKTVDAYGFNCGSGPFHLLNSLKALDVRKDEIISFLPNAGFPEIVHERTMYPNNPVYFARKIEESKKCGVSIVGGCCGTNPSFTKNISMIMEGSLKSIDIISIAEKKINKKENKIRNTFREKLERGQFVTAVELSAPLDADAEKVLKGAQLCRENGIDLVTVPDSPMSKVRADAMLISSKAKREAGIEAMPHVCCRDKNTNAIRSALIGGHIENLRNVLAITGDPISDATRLEAKSVFNLNSFKLIELINGMNEEVFKDDPVYIGAALNLNVRNKESEYQRMLKKAERGASFFLTQPIFDNETFEFLQIVKERRPDLKILAGVMPIVSYKNAVFLNNELPGVTIPEEIIKRFSIDMTREEAQETGIEIAAEFASKLKKVSDGLYFITPFGRVQMIIDIIKRINE